jgi:hypothetical protein
MNKIMPLIIIITIMLLGCSKGAPTIPVNSEIELSNAECSELGGKIKSNYDGFACNEGEMDIGRVNDVKCMCQCCVPK